MAFNNEMLSYFANKMWSKNKDTFVSKVTGKSLSTNDYTNEDKNKLDNLSAGTTTYDNTTSGLSATNVQGAIDELDGSVDTLSTKITTLENADITLSSTLTAGQTSLTFTDARITENSILSAVYTSIFGVGVKSAEITNGSLVLTFKAQIEDMTVKVVIK